MSESCQKVPEYVALSYVWGSAEMKQETGLKPAILLRRDIIEDADDKERTLLPNGLPQTVEDTIALAGIWCSGTFGMMLLHYPRQSHTYKEHGPEQHEACVQLFKPHDRCCCRSTCGSRYPCC